MTDPLDRLLGSLEPPPAAPGLVDRIVAQATALPQTPAPARSPRDRRGAWVRRHRLLAGFIGANLLVASAVAASIASGVELRRVPVIAPVIAALAPSVTKAERPAVRPPQVRAVRPAPQQASGHEQAEAERPLPPRIEARLARGAVFAAEIAAREKAGLPVPPRAKARAALIARQQDAADRVRKGEPVPLELRTDIVRRRLELAPPRLRARLLERVEQRRAAGLPIPPALEAAIEAPEAER
jgi:hypothetical protein